MKKLIFTPVLLLFFLISYTQDQWVQTGSTPEGSGITDILYLETTGDLFAITASNNWPNGDDGGIRRSSDNGDTWTNIFDAYAARTIKEGPDGYLYASVWPYPQDEGLYRSTDSGTFWELLVSVPSGNNIFSVAVKENSPDNIIFAGTRQGVYRSLDNGVTWSYSNLGIPANSWVRSMEVGPNGTIAAGTTNGLYVSFDDGNSWSLVEGEFENDTIVSIMFEVVETDDDEVNLYAGTASGLLILTTYALAYSTALLVHNFNGQYELTRLKLLILTTSIITTYYMVSMYAASGGNFLFSNLPLTNWLQMTNGLPSNFIVSMFTAYIATDLTIRVFLGLFMGGNGGAKVYKRTVSPDITGTVGGVPFSNDLQLRQNFPNPFKNSTRIGFNLEHSGVTVLELFDATGKKVQTLINQNLDSGTHHLDLTGENLDSGMYYYTLQKGGTIVTKKLMVK